ncbi:acyl-CoA dehydrogenase family protein [Streptomyces sp. NPDC012510]|uniref:acyl-CoA dehydrogenase n=1 Tax=Streptomyces sp. NPDC012510 TaxID=3364838 RepID=UPI0036F0A868
MTTGITATDDRAPLRPGPTTAGLEALLAAHEDEAFSPAGLAALDEREEFPGRAVRVLDDAGLAAHYVLTPDSDVTETVRLLRAVARRDLTVAIAHGKTFLGAVPVWLAGSPEQTTELAERVRAGAPVCWGLTERDHGADLFACELAAVAEPVTNGDPEAGAAATGGRKGGGAAGRGDADAASRTGAGARTGAGEGARTGAGEGARTGAGEGARTGAGEGGGTEAGGAAEARAEVEGRAEAEVGSGARADSGAGAEGGVLPGSRAGGLGWRLDGEKWLINNATRSAFACVLARTDPAGGPRGFSLFLVDKRRLSAGAWRDLPKVRTHGIRGADISGFVLDGARLPPDALVGAVGDGIPVVLTSLQLTRIACGALSLGAADHALRLARDFAVERELYGRRLADVPHVRRVLGRAATAALIAEAVALLAARSVHTLPGELSVVSAICKAFVPTRTQETLTSLGELLGVRGFLTSPPGGGFAKLERDHRICAIFDGSTAVNRAALLHQLPRLGRQLRRRRGDADAVRATADLTAALPAFDRGRLSLLSVTGCSVVQALPDAADRAGHEGPPELAALADRLLGELASLEADSVAFVPVAGGLPSAAFDLAARYERAYAATACLLLWLENPALRQGRPGADALWPRACLAALLGEEDPEVLDAMAEVLLDRTTPVFTLLGGAA